MDSFSDVDAVIAGENAVCVAVDDFEAPAATVYRNGAYTVVVNRRFLQSIRDPALRLAVEKGLRIHEYGHILYKSLPKIEEILKEREFNTNITAFKTIVNVNDDVRVEHLVSRDFTSLSKYLSLLLSHMQVLVIQGEKVETKSDLERLVEQILEKAGFKVNPQLLRTLSAYYQAVRVGEVEVSLLNSDTVEDLRFIIPRIFLSRRGTFEAVVKVSDEIYQYLDKKYGIPPEIRIEIIGVRKGETAKGNDISASQGGGRSTQENAGETVPVLPWKTKGEVKEEAEAARQEARKELEAQRQGVVGGFEGGPDHAQLVPPTMSDVTFYMETVAEHIGTIKRLSALFSRLAGKRWFVPAADGDFNTKPSLMQSAYIDSFNCRDERNYYLNMRHSLPDVDVALALDQTA
jgi:hypothetical protein